MSRIVRLREVSEKIFHLEFPHENYYLMCSTLIRFQEHYESPKFRGKVFTLEDYMDWYAPKYGVCGNFTYFNDVLGFNIPSYALQKFYDGEFNPLTKKETKILEIFENHEDPFYIIATCDDFCESTVKHEVAHGLYFINENYKKNVKNILKEVNLNPIYEWLDLKGYHKSHFFDEAQALLIEDAKDFNRCGVRASDYASVRRKLKKNFEDNFCELNNKPKRIKI